MCWDCIPAGALMEPTLRSLIVFRKHTKTAQVWLPIKHSLYLCILLRWPWSIICSVRLDMAQHSNNWTVDYGKCIKLKRWLKLQYCWLVLQAGSSANEVGETRSEASPVLFIQGEYRKSIQTVKIAVDRTLLEAGSSVLEALDCFYKLLWIFCSAV